MRKAKLLFKEEQKEIKQEALELPSAKGPLFTANDSFIQDDYTNWYHNISPTPIKNQKN